MAKSKDLELLHARSSLPRYDNLDSVIRRMYSFIFMCLFFVIVQDAGFPVWNVGESCLRFVPIIEWSTITEAILRLQGFPLFHIVHHIEITHFIRVCGSRKKDQYNDKSAPH